MILSSEKLLNFVRFKIYKKKKSEIIEIPKMLHLVENIQKYIIKI